MTSRRRSIPGLLSPLAGDAAGRTAVRLLQAQHPRRRAQVRRRRGEGVSGRLQVRRVGLCWKQCPTAARAGRQTRSPTWRTHAMAATPPTVPLFRSAARPPARREPGMCDPVCQSGCRLSRQVLGQHGRRADLQPADHDDDAAADGDAELHDRFRGDRATVRQLRARVGLHQRAVVFRPLLQVLQERRRLPECDLYAQRRRGPAAGQKVCDVPFVDTCIPLPGGQNTGCGGTATMACWLSSTSPTRTFCDCPFGDTGSNGPCTRTRDCVRGLACVDRGTGEPSSCLQVCRLGTHRLSWRQHSELPPVLWQPARGQCSAPDVRVLLLGGWRPGDIGRSRRGRSWSRSCRWARAASSPRSRTAAFCARTARTAASARRGSTAPPTAPAARGPRWPARRRRRTSSRSARPLRAPTAIRSARAAVTAGAARTTEQAWSCLPPGGQPAAWRDLYARRTTTALRGNFCRRDCEDMIGRCYRFCGNDGISRDDACGGQDCQIFLNDALGNPTDLAVCDPPVQVCNPVGRQQRLRRPRARLLRRGHHRRHRVRLQGHRAGRRPRAVSSIPAFPVFAASSWARAPSPPA